MNHTAALGTGPLKDALTSVGVHVLATLNPTLRAWAAASRTPGGSTDTHCPHRLVQKHTSAMKILCIRSFASNDQHPIESGPFRHQTLFRFLSFLTLHSSIFLQSLSHLLLLYDFTPPPVQALSHCCWPSQGAAPDPRQRTQLGADLKIPPDYRTVIPARLRVLG